MISSWHCFIRCSIVEQDSLADNPAALLLQQHAWQRVIGIAFWNIWWQVVPSRTSNRNIIQLPAANSATQEQQQENFRRQRPIVPFRIRNRSLDFSSNWTWLYNLVFFWIGSDVGHITPSLETTANRAVQEQQRANKRSIETASLHLTCPPAPKPITVLFSPVK